jgi:DEAD/DEAH box helicase domain-containing protein
MIPTVVTSGLRDTVAEYLRTTYSLRDRRYEQALLEFLADPEQGLFRGPYLDIRLPFRRSSSEQAPPLHVRPSFNAYAHQQLAWERLSSAQGRRPRSTIVATGTGSGKTECFLFPLLDHCLRHAGTQPSVKAIILYPMNALASDQAGRLAELIHNWTPPGGSAPALRHKVSAGLYVGGKGSQSRPSSSQLVDMREHLREQPPDILLTNYRMLDFLLLRPEDAVLWRNNGARSLQYLVLDELHTYDGAQGTDVAFLIRRLRQRLRVGSDHLCCVGTSATIGGRGQAGRQALLRFASEVFAQPFEEDAIVGEDRLSIRETFTAPLDARLSEPKHAEAGVYDPEMHESPLAYVRAQAQAWLGRAPGERGWLPAGLSDDAGQLALGEALDRHPFLRDLLRAQERLGSAGPRSWTDIIAQLPQDSALHEIGGGDPKRRRELQWRVLSSFVSLISVARRYTEGRVVPYLTVQVQLWMREVRRLLRRVPRNLDELPSFAWADEGNVQFEAQYPAPYGVQVYCRECGEAGLGMVEHEGREDLVASPGKVGEAYLQGSPTARYVELGDDSARAGQVDMFATRYLCPLTLHVSDSKDPRLSIPDERGEMHAVERLRVMLHGVDRELDNPRFTRRCPHCQAEDGLTILGSRAASLSSVAIGHLFQSPYNGDPKLLAFTDSVQDASHRAGFFAGRTFRFALRTAIQTVIQATEPTKVTTLAELGERVVEHWRRRLEPTAAELGRAAATLLPPDLRDDPAYAEFMESLENGKRPSAPQRKALDKLLAQRISWEVVREFGLGVVIGRSLEKTGCAVAFADPRALDDAAGALKTWLDEQRPMQRKGDPPSQAQVRQYLLGLTERMRTRGAVHDHLLDSYVRHGTRYWLSRRKAPRLSRFGPRSVLPRFAYHGAMHKIFDPIAAPPKRTTWYRDWTARALGGEVRDDGITKVVVHALELLAARGVVETRSTAGPASAHAPQASGLKPAAVQVSSEVESVACPECGAARNVARVQLECWTGSRCTTFRCKGSWQMVPRVDPRSERHGYYQRVYTSGGVRRVFAEEHTGLLERSEREAVERAFKAGTSPDAPNLLACTPTLEMGIDIGDLSAVMLCSVPPLPANFVQRVGRAGRSTGNALVVTVANAKPHDRYFFEQPEQMMRGDIDPPACFLDAPDMLQRQLVAHALDYWAARTKETKIPRDMKTLLGAANQAGFPNSFYRYYTDNKFVIVGEFLNAFGRDEREHPGWGEIKQLINRLVGRDHVIVAMRDAFAEVEQERSAINKRRKVLSERKAALERDPSLAARNPEDPTNAAKLELEDIEEAIRGYTSQSKSLSSKYPLNVLTDAGVLPNYAFPEPGVLLRATFRANRDDAGTGKGATQNKPGKAAIAGKPIKAEYQRPASAALREFAPFNTFYAEGRKIRITQIDLGTRNDPTIEHWRLCSECHHSEREEPGAVPKDECPNPHCKSTEWRDAGQLRKMISFRRAWSSSTLSEASTSDDSDERDQEHYLTRELIERLPGSDAHDRDSGERAQLIDSDGLLFGYELWSRALLREINFGRVRDTDVGTRVAGQLVTQRGFGVCQHCGRAQEPNSSPVHAPWCRVQTSGAAEQYENVSLYREMTSEAIRVLLPVANHEVAAVLSSVRAALELGFRKKFGGQPMHLRITTMSEPSRDGRIQFLVIYDTVPGGTGYLAELWRSGQLFDVIKHALTAMRECVCARDRDRDGCYRCVYAHQHQRDLSSISRRRAVELFEQILSKRDAVKPIASLSDVSADSLLESELERQFVAALRRHAEARGWEWKEVSWLGHTAWRVRINETLSWELRPQVTLRRSEGLAQECRPDFVFVPIGRGVTRKVAVFTDGFSYHAQPDLTLARIHDDILKRAAILGVSDAIAPEDRHWVFSLTYNDVQAALPEARGRTLAEQAKLLSLPSSRGRTFAKLAQRWPGVEGDPELVARDSFTLLMQWLERPDADAWKKHVLCALTAGLDLDKPHGAGVLAEIDDLATRVDADLPVKLAGTPGKAVFASLRHNGHAIVAARLDTTELGAGRLAALAGVLRLDDSHGARKTGEYEPAWRGFLQAWNLLQFHEGGFVVTSSELLVALEGTASSEPAEPVVTPTPDMPAQPDVSLRLSVDYAALVEDFREGELLWRLLNGRSIPAPQEPITFEPAELTGIDDAHLVWLHARVALQAGADEHDIRKAHEHGWRLFDTDKADPELIIAALHAGERA